MLARFYSVLRMAWVDIEIVLELLKVEDSITEVQNPIEANINRGEIEFRNVSFTYDRQAAVEDQRPILKDVSFKVQAGSRVGIVG